MEGGKGGKAEAFHCGIGIVSYLFIWLFCNVPFSLPSTDLCLPNENFELAFASLALHKRIGSYVITGGGKRLGEVLQLCILFLFIWLSCNVCSPFSSFPFPSVPSLPFIPLKSTISMLPLDRS